MQPKLTGNWKQITVLWVVIVAVYVAVAFGFNQARVSRFSADEQQEIFTKLQDLWCSNLEIADRDARDSLERSVLGVRARYKLTELDMRIIFQRGITLEESVQPCLYEAVTWTQCVARTDDQLALNIGGAFGLSVAETDRILALGESQGWAPHVCLSEGDSG